MNSTILRCIRSNQILNLGTKRQAPWQPRAPGPRDVARCHQLRKRDERLWLKWIILSSAKLKKTLECMAVTWFFSFHHSFLKTRLSRLPKKLQEQVYFSYVWLIGIQVANYLSCQTAFSAYNKHTAKSFPVESVIPASCAASARCRAATSSGSILRRLLDRPFFCFDLFDILTAYKSSCTWRCSKHAKWKALIKVFTREVIPFIPSKI